MNQRDEEKPDLSAALDQMADEAEATPPPVADAPAEPGAMPDPVEGADEAPEAADAGDAEPSRGRSPGSPGAGGEPESARPRRRAAAKRSSRSRLMAMAVPALVGLGAVMVIPGGWALLELAGIETWLSDRPGADTVAAAMLATWPIALCLIAGGWYFHRQSRQEKPARPPRR